MALSTQDESERKYEVTRAVDLPCLAGEDGVAAVTPAVEHELRAVYYDTADFHLARRGLTLRRRTGGDDAGWHLKVPSGPDTRTELRHPLGRATGTVPTELLDPVRALVRDHPLSPVARISTRRREHRLLGEDDTVLAVVCDDEVEAERLRPSPLAVGWREWEVELVTGTRSLLQTVERRLVAAGATPAGAASKLARVLGDAAPAPAPRPSRKSLRRGSTAHLLTALLAAQVAEVQVQDAGVRADRAGSIHHLRIAARRLRSTLTTYRPLLDPTAPDFLREELRWLGQSLGRARDAQVLRDRLLALLASEPPELVVGPVAQRIADELGQAYRNGLDEARGALDSARYFRLLDALDELVTAAPLTSRADESAKDVVPRLLQRDAERLQRAVTAIESTPPGPTAGSRDLALHEARKKAKRLRYAGETAIPVFGSRATVLAGAAKALQDSLGQHQDAVVAREHLRELATLAEQGGDSAFTFGRLHALEQARAEQAEAAFVKAWAALPHKKIRRWIRK